MVLVSITSLWLPIVLASVLVFVASSVLHMFLTFHRNDYAALPDEDAAMDALRSIGASPGNYYVPFAGTAADMRSEAYLAKRDKGPVAFVTVVAPKAAANMGPQLVQWFVYTVVVSIIAAYVAGRTVGPGAEYLSVFRLTGTVAFACYAMGVPVQSIWFFQNWPATLRSMFDGLVYALLTAGAFGWLWPA